MLHIHRAERADRLVEALADAVAPPLGDPFAPEVIAVPTRGVERWLSQRLADTLGAQPGRADGVCANVDLPFPGAVVGGAVAAVTGIDRDRDPWLPERAVWPLLAVVDAHLAEGWLAPLAGHLAAGAPVGPVASGPTAADPDAPRDRRFGALRHLADLFDRYAVHRPAMVRTWVDGEDLGGDGTPLPADARWQPRLWRLLREAVATPSPAERLPDACEHLRAHPERVDLPARLSLFGLTRLPASYLDVLHALAAARDVHLFLLHPSPALWAEVAASGAARGPVPRSEDGTDGYAINPLLRTWGRDAREMQLVLAGGGPARDHHHTRDRTPTTLLERLQADVRADRRPPGEPLPGDVERRAPLDPEDRSVQVHACHGRARQVEVLRDAILHLLAADPTLEPRDVIVLCPDIETFAPLIHATFGAGDALQPDGDAAPEGTRGDGALPDLRVRLADRSLRQTNPVLGAVAALLDLASSRLTASQVLDLASREPVRRRFGLDDDALARIEEWVAATGIRWGLDEAQREPTKVRLREGTWRAGLDRVLLGVAMAEEEQRLVAGVLPLDDVDSGDIDLAGRLAELLDRLGAACTALTEPQPVAGWAAALTTAADTLLAVPPSEGWQRAALQRLLDDVVTEAGADSGQVLTPAEIRDLLAARLQGRPTRASFRTGHLTVCTLVPMRSVPHRVVCLLGLDDGVFPRRTTPDGDDLVARAPHVGDRDPRSEDRQLLLDALLAAGDHLVVTYAGRDERTNAALPPAVPVGELLDAVDATVHLPGGDRPARAQVVTAHPLQPFDVRNYTPAALRPATPWSFDRTGLQGALALAGPRAEPAGFLADGPLPEPAADLVELDDLVRFVQHPVRAFLRQRLGIVLPGGTEEPGDALPVELDKLEEWALGQRLLEARLGGADRDTARAAELARGLLPPGRLVDQVLPGIEQTVERLVAVVGDELGAVGAAGAVDLHVALPDGRTLVGTVLDVDDGLVRAVTYSRVGPRHRLAAWVRLLALTAAHPETAFRATTVGRGPKGRTVVVAGIPPLGEDPQARRRTALAELAVVLDLHRRGLREPLPLHCKTSAAYAEAARAGRSTDAAVASAWESGWRRGYRFTGEDADPEHRLVLGSAPAARDLLAARPRDDECGPGWDEADASRLGRYATRLWRGLLDREAVRPR